MLLRQGGSRVRENYRRPELDELGVYEFGWHDQDDAGVSARRGINEEVVTDISGKKDEPAGCSSVA
jgi:hypothetical protein